MSSLSPRLTLLLLSSVAVLILAGGLRLTRFEETVRIDRNRDALRRFSLQAQSELDRLADSYENHLKRVAASLSTDEYEMRKAADGIVGIRQFSLLHPPTSKTADTHVQVYSKADEPLQRPTWQTSEKGFVGPMVSLDENKLLGSDSGWIDEPGKPLMFWLRKSPSEVAVLTIDAPAVQTTINRWFETWSAQPFTPVPLGGGSDQFRMHRGPVLAIGGGEPKGQPDLLLPLNSHFGAWELASWDERQTQIRYHTSALVVTGTLSVLVALLGVVLFAQQRRTIALAAQRVSFVNRVSHELRTPLTNILLNVDIIADALEDIPRDTSRRLSLLQEEARRLGRLIDNVLTFSRHEQGKLRSEPRACVPNSIIAAVVEQFEPSFHRHGLEIRRTGDVPAACLLDADAFAQILANLLSNVEKYVPGGTVEIASTLADGFLSVTVSDQGPGIPAEAAKRIFLPFERLDSRTNEGVTGTGLGLAIAKDLATTMGGSLRLLPSERGASFEIRLPSPLASPLSISKAV